jgi:amino acid transporter
VFVSLSIYRHREYLKRENVPHVQRWNDEDTNDYPYRSHRQPLLAHLALIGCIFVLLVANGAALWNGFHLLPFLASYLTVRKRGSHYVNDTRSY